MAATDHEVAQPETGEQLVCSDKWPVLHDLERRTVHDFIDQFRVWVVGMLQLREAEKAYQLFVC